MCIETIKDNLIQDKYIYLQEFKDDIELIFQNCYIFNPIPTNVVHKNCKKFEEKFKTRWEKLLKQLNECNINYEVQQIDKGRARELDLEE